MSTFCAKIENTVLTDERRAQIKAKLKQGVPASEVARELGVGRSTVQRIKSQNPGGVGDRAAYRTISTKVSGREEAAFDGVVRTQGWQTRSKLLRRLMRSVAGYFAATPDEEAYLAEAMAHLSRLGGNFNQIARDLSVSVSRTGEANPTRAQIDAIFSAADEVIVMKSALRQMLQNSQYKTQRLLADLDADDPFGDMLDE